MIKELIIPFGVMAMLAAMLLPLPPALMDVLLVANLLFALVLLVSTLYIAEPLKLSALPTILLLATLYRLSLNISTTRLILGSGDAGRAVEAFGHVVIQGNLVVGAVIFLIITLIQFIVIAKGAERVAEVAARFTLDALPGKQMSIDADVRAGLIDFETARQKRQDLQTESRFYGALDGAMKFIKGDAIAGIIIVVINIVGGLLIGVMVEGLEVGAAVQKYTLLTVGDGLLSQIPALLSALAAGMVVTRVTRGDGVPLARELLTQLGQVRKAQIIIGLIALGLALVPDMPVLPCVALATVLFISAALATDEAATNSGAAAPNVFKPRLAPLLAIEVRGSVEPKIDRAALSQQVDHFRQKVYETTGILLARPEFEVVPALACSARIVMRGLPARDIALAEGAEAELNGLIVAALHEVVQSRSVEFVDDILTRRTLDFYDKDCPELVSAVVPGVITLTQLTEILKGLAREGLSIRNFDLILQAVAEHGPKAGNDRALLQEVRVALKRLISARYRNDSGAIAGFTMDPVLDLSFQRCERDNATLDLQAVQQLGDFLMAQQDPAAPLVVSKGSRAIIRDCLMMRGIVNPVLALDELVSDLPFVNRGVFEVNDEGTSNRLIERLAAA